MKRAALALFPVFLFLLPIGFMGHLEQTPSAPLLPYTIAALASVLFGAFLAHKGGAIV